MAFPILGTPKPAFFDSSGDPLVSGTLTVQDPDTSSAKATYPTAGDADAGTNGTTSAITLDSRGEPSSTQLWGRDGEDYKVIVKDSSGSTILTLDEIRLPLGSGNALRKVKTADESLTDTTLAADTHLQGYVLAASTYYKVEGFLYAAAAGASQDLKIDFVGDFTPSGEYNYVLIDSTTAGTVDAGELQRWIDATTIDIDGTAEVGIHIVGWMLTASNETTLDLHVAQGTDSGTTTLKKGSWLTFEPLVSS